MLYPQNMNIAVGTGKIRKLWIFLSFFLASEDNGDGKKNVKKAIGLAADTSFLWKLDIYWSMKIWKWYQHTPAYSPVQTVRVGQWRLCKEGDSGVHDTTCVRVFLGEMLTSSPRGMQWSCSSKKSLIKFLLFDLWQIILQKYIFLAFVLAWSRFCLRSRTNLGKSQIIQSLDRWIHA